MRYENDDINEYEWNMLCEHNEEEIRERFKYGFPSDSERIKDKNLLTYSAMLTQSNWYDKDLDDRRFLYYNKLDKKEIANTMKVSQRTVNRNINALIKTGLVEAINTENGVVYKFNYKKDDKYFVEIENDIMKELIHTSTNVIATYVLMKYHLKDSPKQMTQEYIAEEIGLGKTCRAMVRQITKILAKLGLIIIHKRFEQVSVMTEKGLKVIPKEILIYELVDYDDWKILDTIIERKRENEVKN